MFQSIKLPHCWVCGRRFITSTPPGDAHNEEHHIIPQAQGGKDGPTVSLCDGHHTTLHKIASRLHSKKPHFDLVQHEGEEAKKKLLWLAVQVFNAETMMRNDPNKRTAVMLSIDARQRQMFDQLKKVYPSLNSRAAILNLALENLWRKHFSS